MDVYFFYVCQSDFYTYQANKMFYFSTLDNAYWDISNADNRKISYVDGTQKTIAKPF